MMGAAWLLRVLLLLGCRLLWSTLTLATVPNAARELMATRSLLCDRACDRTLTLELTSDQYGSETTWRLVPASSSSAATECGVVFAGGGPYAEVQSPVTYIETVSASLCAEEAYNFTLLDSAGDGICCEWGIGGFVLYLDGDVSVGSGAAFGFADTVSFIVPLPPPTPPPTPPPSLRPPTQVPTPRPTRRSVLCGVCDQSLSVMLWTDSYGSELTWRLTEPGRADGCDVLGRNVTGGPFENIEGGALEEAVASTTLCAGRTYTFTLADSFGDGMHFGFDGYFELRLGRTGAIVASGGGDWGASTSAVFTLASAPTPGPTPLPTPTPHPNPTLAPAPLPTPLPSRHPAPEPTVAPAPTLAPSVQPTTPRPTASPVVFRPGKANRRRLSVLLSVFAATIVVFVSAPVA